MFFISLYKHIISKNMIIASFKNIQYISLMWNFKNSEMQLYILNVLIFTRKIYFYLHI